MYILVVPSQNTLPSVLEARTYLLEMVQDQIGPPLKPYLRYRDWKKDDIVGMERLGW